MLIKESTLSDQDNTYFIGDCHSFAIALHRLTGAPMMSICRKYLLPENEWYGDEEDDKYQFEHCHAGILVGENLYVDAKGLHRFDPKAFDGLWMGRPGSLETSDPYIQEFDDEEHLASCYADYDEAIIEEAMEEAQKWGCVEIVKQEINNSAKSPPKEIKKKPRKEDLGLN